ncbi:MAG: hypothetical protein LBB15_00750 [Puniceicoccales bacterium]|jgi:hypothetical protein|nr:hypothetical protein [Puniceicoccales bacterium]
MQPGEAALAALFSPFRQCETSTCVIHAAINAEGRNHPERLVTMLGQVLSEGKCNTPSGYLMRVPPTEGNGYITIDQSGTCKRNLLYICRKDGQQVTDDEQIRAWKEAGIQFDKTKPDLLHLPVHNLHDVLLVSIVQAILNNPNNIASSRDFGVLYLYTGYTGDKSSASEPHLDSVNAGTCEDEANKSTASAFERDFNLLHLLQRQAETQKQNGMRYMPIVTHSVTHGGHMGNIDIEALLALNLGKMNNGDVYPIGDRNWMKGVNVRLLAVKKENDTYKFVTVSQDARGKIVNTGDDEHICEIEVVDLTKIRRIPEEELAQLEAQTSGKN